MERNVEQITEAWQTYVLQGKVNDKLDTSIKRSWQRCSEYEINPFQESNDCVLQANNLQEKLEEYEEIIRVATPIMKELHQSIKGSNFIVVLTDNQGHVLKSIGDDSFMPKAQKVYLIEGASWHEKVKGTNAIGTVIEEESPLNVYASEHFFQENHFLTCSAAPIFDADDNFIGVIDISGDYHSAQRHTLGMVVAAASAIQRQLLLQHLERELMISEKQKELILNSTAEGFFTVNNEGVITQINQKGSQLLGYAPQECIGKKFETFFPESTFSSLMKLTTDGTEKSKEMVWNLKQKRLQVTSKVINEEEEVTGLVIKINDFSAQKKSETKKEQKTDYSFSDIIGQSREIRKMIRIAQKVANSDSTILLTGESGTGKELFAQAIHNYSSRQDKEFVPINCGAIPEDLMESELFGYQDGAFTGAKRGGKPGKFELADDGTIFLDEIGELNFSAQVKLLRVLQERKVSRLGSNELIPVDVRIIAATNKNLKERIKTGDFREDLYYRLNVINLELPPLRERGEDIIILAEYFIEKLGMALGKYNVKLSEPVKKTFKNYNWPGNIRELKNGIESALNLIEGLVIKKEHIPDYLGTETDLQSQHYSIDDELLSLKEAEARAIRKALKYFEGNISRAARHLEIGRNTLYRKIEKYGINI
ncbi:sigma-54-dependent Fis family transcriptional regulator [Acetohalobium arabaticum]|uniref:GAF modulated sigma54 specific transcriptional regulator, Fis family n=1 Tax=Acetohalobium arabaticum (strain ATCC 49924 / DSM 5501 / Z-7288) TaxID=574087 RepID=D9QPR7_ACEAZ|nr:sigma-54-dependent Fis family transcriptional regulator [Acetohalobium arabaticum]ADL12508.1 GAF modulated sigma54 specific transcriptional regulator, Fis family [Acetohalobium arabaticum DSM 5501]